MKAHVSIDGVILPGIEVPMTLLTLGDRLKRTTKMFSILFLAGMFSILIPVLHFFLVPSLILASFIVAYRKLQEIYFLDISKVDCPSCRSKFKQNKIFAVKDSQHSRVYCYECQKQIYFMFIYE